MKKITLLFLLIGIFSLSYSQNETWDYKTNNVYKKKTEKTGTPGYYTICVNNHTDRTIYVAIKCYVEGKRKPVVKGWYKYEPGEKDSETGLHSVLTTRYWFYYYIRTEEEPDGSYNFWPRPGTGDGVLKKDGRTFESRKVKMPVTLIGDRYYINVGK